MVTKTLALGGVVMAAVAALLWARNGDPAPTATASPPPTRVAPGTVPYRGMAIQVASGHYRPGETYGQLLQECADLGANCVLLCFPGQMEHAASQSIFMDLRKIPPPEELKALVQQGNRLGLKVILMPVVLLRNPRGSEWRGVIDPPSWDAWWEEYEEFVLFFADVARAGGADALMVGSELVSTEKYTDRWRRLIAKARERFYGGKLGYSANWDHYRPIEFWDALDFVGMTSYYTLADRKNASVDDIMRRWLPIQAEILAWQRQIDKPLLFTEVGWCSQEGAATAPWNYYQNQHATPGGLEEQRRLYEAFIRVWGQSPELMGIIWWEWSPAAGGAGDYGYTPRGKPAEQLLRQWLGGDRTPAPTSAPGASDAP